MDNSEQLAQIKGQKARSDDPSARILFLEKRKSLKDRRSLRTYLADDRRNGRFDRRRSPVRYQYREDIEIEDRRRIHTYIADDQRSGIADRRKSKRFLPALEGEGVMRYVISWYDERQKKSRRQNNGVRTDPEGNIIHGRARLKDRR